MLLNKMQIKTVHHYLLFNKHQIQPQSHHKLTYKQCCTLIKYCFLNKIEYYMDVF